MIENFVSEPSMADALRLTDGRTDNEHTRYINTFQRNRNGAFFCAVSHLSTYKPAFLAKTLKQLMQLS